MTPFGIKIIMHIFAMPLPIPASEQKEPIYNDTMGIMVRHGLVEQMIPDPDNYGCEWRLTDKGQAYCEALCNMQMPVAKWIIPAALVQ